MLERRVVRAINEYRLVKDGVTGYDILGYSLDDGRIIAPKLLEYLVVDQAYVKAQNEKIKQK